MYSCTHVLMYPLSVEPDLCEVAPAAWPAEQSAVVLFTAMCVTGGPDDDVLISDT